MYGTRGGVEPVGRTPWLSAIDAGPPITPPLTERRVRLLSCICELAMVYPFLTAAGAGNSRPARPARSSSVYRFRKDFGSAVGDPSAGVIADVFGLPWAVGPTGVPTFFSGGRAGRHAGPCGRSDEGKKDRRTRNGKDNLWHR